MTIMFLDFDGVVHAYAPWPHDDVVRARYFEFLPRLESVLRDFPEVRIVIASDWRLYYPLDELRAFFSADIRDRVIATTALEKSTSDAVGHRHLQVERFLQDSGLTGSNWVAVDDTEMNYRPDAKLVLCRNCFGQDEESRLRALLDCFYSGVRAESGA